MGIARARCKARRPELFAGMSRTKLFHKKTVRDAMNTEPAETMNSEPVNLNSSSTTKVQKLSILQLEMLLLMQVLEQNEDINE